MKRILSMVMAVAVILGVSGIVYSKEKEAKQSEMASATSEKAASVSEKKGVPDKVQVILKGVVTKEKDFGITGPIGYQIVIKTETGQSFVAWNPPYVNTLRSECIGKTVKVKGTTIAETSFKHYPGIYILDIIEVK